MGPPVNGGWDWTRIESSGTSRRADECIGRAGGAAKYQWTGRRRGQRLLLGRAASAACYQWTGWKKEPSGIDLALNVWDVSVGERSGADRLVIGGDRHVA